MIHQPIPIPPLPEDASEAVRERDAAIRQSLVNIITHAEQSAFYWAGFLVRDLLNSMGGSPRG